MLISLENNPEVVARQVFNAPLACIKPTRYSVGDFVLSRDAILREFGGDPGQGLIAWFDMTDAETIRAHLDTFGNVISNSDVGDVIRFTVDVDAKTFGRRQEGETLGDLAKKRFTTIRELLGNQMRQGARVRDLSSRLGTARLVLHAFRLMAEEAMQLDQRRIFEPLSLTTYADGHRMLSVTGAVLERTKVAECRARMNLGAVPGGAADWTDLVHIQIPQLTVWEKLSLDRKPHEKTPKQMATELSFRLHDTVPTVELLQGYQTFQRFYPNFRHVVL